jgi:hypothetical protein
MASCCSIAITTANAKPARTAFAIGIESCMERPRLAAPDAVFSKKRSMGEKSAMRSLRLCIVGLLPVLAATAAAPTTLKGVIIDKACSSKAEVRLLPSGIEGGMIVAEAHTRECALMPACQKSGYGIFTWDQKFVAFDSSGNRKALEAIKASKKLDDFEVEVTGILEGDTIKVESLKLAQ